jgi:heat shock protein 1/8
LKLTVQKATSLFLYSLKTSAEEFLGRKVDGAVISVPSWWGSGERAALREAAGEAGIHVYQLASEEGLAVLGSENSRTADAVPEGAKQDDRTTLVIDLGGSSLTLNVLSIKHSIVNSLSSAHIPSLGGSTVDSYLISHFSKEFTKKTKTPLPLPASTPGDRKAEAKMRLAVEHTKRTLSASTGAAACSVESLKDGLDFNGSINRLRFDVLLSPFYAQIIDHVSQVLAKANVPKEGINEVLLVGGSAGLPGLIERLVLYFGEGPGAAVIRDDLDPSQLIAKGAALQARLISELPEDSPLIRAFEDGTEVVKTKSSSKPIGLVFPGAEEQVVVVVPSHAPLPARRTVQFKSPGGKRLGMDIYEGEEVLRVIPGQEKPKVERDADDDDEEEEEEEPQKEVIVTKGQHLGSFVLPLDPKKELVEIRIDVHLDRSIHVAGRTISGTSGNDDWVSWTA